MRPNLSFEHFAAVLGAIGATALVACGGSQPQPVQANEVAPAASAPAVAGQASCSAAGCGASKGANAAAMPAASAAAPATTRGRRDDAHDRRARWPSRRSAAASGEQRGPGAGEARREEEGHAERRGELRRRDLLEQHQKESCDLRGPGRRPRPAMGLPRRAGRAGRPEARGYRSISSRSRPRTTCAAGAPSRRSSRGWPSDTPSSPMA